jgi:hypothetical membrane protein
VTTLPHPLPLIFQIKKQNRFLLIISEAVAGLVGRADVGACMFFIAALLAYIKSCPDHTTGSPENEHISKRTNWSLLLVSLGLSAASMLTKEQDITVLGVCAVYEAIIVSKINLRALKASLQKVNKWQQYFKLSMHLS